LPELAADLVRRQVAVIAATGGTASALSAKLATTTIPIVFGVPEDPVKLGLVASLARPGGNLTGINFFIGELAAKQLGLLREIVPTAARIAVLTNPANVRASATAVAEVEAAARTMGLQTQVFNASTHALGWTEGKNLRIDWYWTAGDVGRIRSDVAGLARHPPDIIVANGRVTLSEALQVIRSIPIVFVLVTDPVGQGFISSLARPGGNVTGFTFFEYAMFGKSLELLKKVAPAVTRVGFIFNPDMSAYYDQFLPDSRRMPGSIRSS
jgi:ABC-type uncharacterized transport system substrate-binding protein